MPIPRRVVAGFQEKAAMIIYEKGAADFPRISEETEPPRDLNFLGKGSRTKKAPKITAHGDSAGAKRSGSLAQPRGRGAAAGKGACSLGYEGSISRAGAGQYTATTEETYTRCCHAATQTK